jgi:Lipopolysaccharide export system permease LptF/LptG
MRISDRYIGKQVLLGTLYAVMVLGIVLVLGRLFKEIQPLLVDMKAPPGIVLRFIINTLPVSLTYTVPWGFLTAVLVVFGRLSSGHEITSFRVAGISLPRLAAPVFMIGTGLSLFSLWLNTNIVPSAKTSLREMLFDQAKRDPSSLLKPGTVVGDKYFKKDDGTVPRLLIEGKSAGWVEGFHAYLLPESKNVEGASREMLYIHAAKAALSANQEKGQLVLKLQDAYTEKRDAEGKTSMGFAGEAEPVIFELKTSNKKIRPDTMTNEDISYRPGTRGKAKTQTPL